MWKQKNEEYSAIDEKVSRDIIAPAHSLRDAQPLDEPRNLETKESCPETLNELLENFIYQENLNNSVFPEISSRKEKNLDIAAASSSNEIAEVHHPAPLEEDALIQQNPNIHEDLEEQEPANLFQHPGSEFPFVRLPERLAKHRFVPTRIPSGPRNVSHSIIHSYHYDTRFIQSTFSVIRTRSFLALFCNPLSRTLSLQAGPVLNKVVTC